MVKIKSIDASKARNNLSEIMEKTFFEGDVYVLERREVPMSVVVGVNDYQEVVSMYDRKTREVLKNLRNHIFARVDERNRRENLLGITAAELVASGRQEREEKYEHSAKSRR